MNPTATLQSRVSRPNNHRPRFRRTLVLLTVLALVTAGVAPYVGTASAAEEWRADVVIVFDRTPNMESDRDILGERIADYARQLEDDRVDARFAVVAYEGDRPGDTEVVQEFTRDRDALTDAFEFEVFGTIENASNGIRTATTLDFREDAERIVVVVSDEDDDGTAAAREDALDTVEELNITMIAVSPDENGVDDLQRMALITDGRWVDIENRPFEDVLDETFDLIERLVKDIPGSDVPARFEVTGTFNRTEVEVGEPVGLTVDITNVGGRNGSFVYLLTVDGERLNQSEGGIQFEPGDRVTISETLTYDRTGGYDVEVRSHYLGRFVVTGLRETNTTVDFRNADPESDGLVLSIRDARAGETVPLELPDLRVGREEGVVFDELRIAAADGVIRNLTADLTQHDTKPAGVPGRPDDGVGPFLTWLDVDASGTEHVANVTFVLRVRPAKLEGLPPENLAVYRYTGSGDWTRLETTYTGDTGDDYRYEVTSPGFSTFAVGARDGEFRVVAANVSEQVVGVNESVTVEAVVENSGDVTGDYRAVLTANGEFVDDTVVTVPAGDTRNVSFTTAFGAAGEYRLAVGDRTAGNVTVEGTATATPTPTPPETPTPTPTATEATPESPTPTASGEETPGTTETGGQPGFGLVTGLLALLAAALLATRQRD